MKKAQNPREISPENEIFSRGNSHDIIIFIPIKLEVQSKENRIQCLRMNYV